MLKLHLSSVWGRLVKALGICKNTVSVYQYKYYDELTGLPNRHYLHELIIHLTLTTRTRLTLALIELKPTYSGENQGFLTHDLVIKQAVEILKKNIFDKNIIISRYDACRIAVLFTGMSEKVTTSRIVDMISKLGDIALPGDENRRLEPYAGIASYPEPAHDARQLVSMAEMELHDIREYNYSNVSRFKDVFATLRTMDKTEEEFLLIACTLLKIINLVDHYTYAHSLRVSTYCDLLAAKLALSPADRKNLYFAALLHDVGKLGVAKEILCKQDSLTDHEWEAVKKHPLLSAEMLQQSGHFPHLIPVLRHHHENYDGTGYPDGLAGDLIPLASRLLSIADSYDAITTNRPYRPARKPEEALQELRAFAGRQFDPLFVPIFCNAIIENHIEKQGS